MRLWPRVQKELRRPYGSLFTGHVTLNRSSVMTGVVACNIFLAVLFLGAAAGICCCSCSDEGRGCFLGLIIRVWLSHRSDEPELQLRLLHPTTNNYYNKSGSLLYYPSTTDCSLNHQARKNGRDAEGSRQKARFGHRGRRAAKGQAQNICREAERIRSQSQEQEEEQAGS